MSDKLIVRVQGACLTDPAGPGGYAGTIDTPEGVVRVKGSHPGTNSARMTMAALIESLRLINSLSDRNDTALVITSDETLAWALSTGAAHNWDNAGWQMPNGDDVPNQDLWFYLLQAAGTRPIRCALNQDQPDLRTLALEHARNARSVGYPTNTAARAQLQPA